MSCAIILFYLFGDYGWLRKVCLHVFACSIYHLNLSFFSYHFRIIQYLYIVRLSSFNLYGPGNIT